MTSVEPYAIRCAEIWGGVAAKQDEIETPGVRAAIYSTVGGGEKGGDIYYFSVCAYDTLTRIAIADVRGHGEGVSHLSEWLYASLERHMNDDDGASVLTELNSLAHSRGFEAITTAAIVTLHRDKGLLHYANAGHPPLLHWNSARDAWQPLETDSQPGLVNLPLGVMPKTKYIQQTVPVKPGDRLFVYTDGVSECPNSNEELFGDHKLLASLVDTTPLSISASKDRLVQEMTSFSNGALEHDDITYMVVEIRPPKPFYKRRFIAKKRPLQSGKPVMARISLSDTP